MKCNGYSHIKDEEKLNHIKNRDVFNKSESIKNLIDFIRKNSSYHDENINTLVSLISSVLTNSVAVQSKKMKKSSFVITMILNEVDSCILEKIDKEIIKSAEHFKENKAMHRFSQSLHRFTNRNRVPSPPPHETVKKILIP